MNRIFSNTIFYLLIFLVIIGIVSFLIRIMRRLKNISYDDLYSQLEKGNVKSFEMQPERGVYEIRGDYKKGTDKNSLPM